MAFIPEHCSSKYEHIDKLWHDEHDEPDEPEEHVNHYFEHACVYWGVVVVTGSHREACDYLLNDALRCRMTEEEMQDHDFWEALHLINERLLNR